MDAVPSATRSTVGPNDTAARRTAEKTYRFGRIRPNGTPALRLAIPIGLSVALALAAVQLLNNPDGPNKWVAAIILAAFLAPSVTGLVWVACVDRSTLPGAVRDTENSVESTWYSKAAFDAFHLTFAVCGVGSGVASKWNATVSWTLAAIAAFSAIAFLVSYLLHKVR
ncbi:hypothetical protein DDD63_02965 [Actinobaculum sp. 313]|nr:hypothetical protein DDD63_02965 [Actinobaculum sp. 313]